MIGKKKKAGAKGALEEAKNWYADRYQFVIVQRNVLAIVTVLALAGLGITTFAVARIADSKTFEPYVIEVESKSGITTLVDNQTVQKYTADEMVIRYFLHTYVTAREGYDITRYEYDYNKVVRLFSSPEVYNAFYAQINPSFEGSDSPVKYGRSISRVVKVKSISFLDNTYRKAQVRIEVDQVGTGVASWTKHYIVTADFQFFPLALSPEERYINPLGFQITGYRRDIDSAS
jgi:type IV secretion system protein VirB8